MIKCPNPDCGYQNVDGTQFCEGCGEELPQSHTAGGAAAVAAPASGDNRIKCPACDNLNPPDNVVCEVCGTELKAMGTGGGTSMTPDAAMAPPVAGVLDATPGATPVPGATPDPAHDTTTGSVGGAGLMGGVGADNPALTGTVTVPATAAPVGGMASPPASTGQSALDASATHSATSPSVPAIATGAGSALPDHTPAGDAAFAPSVSAPPSPAPLDTTTSAAPADVAMPPVPTTPTAGGNLEPGRVKLTVEQGMTVGSQFVLGDNEMLVGREDEEEGIYPDLDLSDQDAGYVHRRHATLKFENGHLTLTHLGGTNKTRINNRPLPDNVPQPVNMGDKIAFGKVVLRVQPN